MGATTERGRSWLEERRRQAWQLKTKGWPQNKIAEALDVTEGAVSQWLKRGRQGGVEALRARKRGGSRPELGAEERGRLLELLERGAEAFGFEGEVWTLPRIADAGADTGADAGADTGAGAEADAGADTDAETGAGAEAGADAEAEGSERKRGRGPGSWGRMRPVEHAIPSFLRPPLDAYAARLRAIFGDRLRELRLFGSYARGEADEDSDIDVLVLIDGLTDLEIGVAAGEVAPVIIATGLPLAPLAMSTERLEGLRKAERLLARDLDEEGIPL